MTQPVVTTDWIANRVIVSQRKKIWKCSREWNKCPSISRSWKSKAWGEREATCASARTTLNTLRRTSLCYGCPSAMGILSRLGGSRRWAQDPCHRSTSVGCYAHGLDEWGFAIPKHSRVPRSSKDFWVTRRKSRQSYHNWSWLLGCFMPLTHQFGIRMTQKWKFLFLFWTVLVCLEEIWDNLTQDFVQAVQIRYLRIHLEKSSYQSPWKT